MWTCQALSTLQTHSHCLQGTSRLLFLLSVNRLPVSTSQPFPSTEPFVGSALVTAFRPAVTLPSAYPASCPKKTSVNVLNDFQNPQFRYHWDSVTQIPCTHKKQLSPLFLNQTLSVGFQNTHLLHFPPTLQTTLPLALVLNLPFTHLLRYGFKPLQCGGC